MVRWLSSSLSGYISYDSGGGYVGSCGQGVSCRFHTNWNDGAIPCMQKIMLVPKVHMSEAKHLDSMAMAKVDKLAMI